MKRGLFVAAIVISLRVAADSPSPSLTIPNTASADPSAVVEGCVNALTGSYFEVATDLAVRSSEPIHVNRVHVSRDEWDECRGQWRLWPGSIEVLEMHLPAYRLLDLYMDDEFGSVVCFEKGGQPKKPINTDSFSNTAGGELSGRTNLKNYRLSNNGPNELILRTGSGEIRVFSCVVDEWIQQLESPKRPKRRWYHIVVPGLGETYAEREVRRDLQERVDRANHTYKYRFFVLTRIIRPNGNELFFRYDDNRTLRGIEAYFSAGYELAAAVSLRGAYHLSATDGQRVSHRQIIHQSANCGLRHTSLHQVDLPGGRWTRYTYDATKHKHISPFSIIRRDLPDGRFREIAYCQDDSDHSGRVASLTLPRGSNGEPTTVARLEYSTYKTRVFDVHDNLTTYEYDSDHHLTEKVLHQGTEPFRVEQFAWGRGQDVGNLIARSVLDEAHQPLSATSYTYDERGNVLVETLWGDLSGGCTTALELKARRPVDNGVDRFEVRATYSDDGFNLKLSETAGERTVSYRYLPKSNLLIAKLTSDQEGIQLREFWEYNRQKNPIFHIQDDGCSEESRDLAGVTYRKIRRFEYDSAGLVNDSRELYWDPETDAEQLLTRTHLIYNERRLVAEKQVYDAYDAHRYSLLYDYDDADRLIRETDALGHEVLYAYDLNDNRLSETGPHPNHHTFYTYDLANRLVCVEKQGIGETYQWESQYDERSNPISQSDPCMQRTDYTYDALGRVTQTVYPAIHTEQGWQRPEAHRIYDALGNITTETDPNGEVTRRRYTARGQVVKEYFPDETQASYCYSLEGHLIGSIDRLGIVSQFERDYLGRVTAEKHYSSDGSQEQTRAYTYKGVLKTLEIDPEGVETRFHYDSAGRLIGQSTGHARTTYTYDELGRRNAQYDWVDSTQYRVTRWVYDLLNRVIEERVEDRRGVVSAHTTYAYDAAGNQTLTSIHDQEVYTTRHCYNRLGEVISTIDPLGHCTTIRYDRSYPLNEGRALRVTAIDPLGNLTHTLYDPLSHVTSLTRENAHGLCTASTQYRYDLAGQRTHAIHSVIADGQQRDILTNVWSYGPMGRVVQLSESDGAKVTSFHYNPFGELATTCKPGGATLHRHYDGFGRLYRHSGPGFDDTYSYDACDRIRLITHLDGSITRRSYDSNGNLTLEALANGLTLSFSYDSLDRPIATHLPDGSAIAYTYDPLHLSAVSRLDRGGTATYTHSYAYYDQRGHCLTSELPFSGTSLTHHYDALGRCDRIQGPHFQQTLDAFDASGNLRERTTIDPLGERSDHFTYDDLYQFASENEHAYSHDSLHNRLALDGLPCAISHLNQLLSFQDHRYDYNDDGCLTAQHTPHGTLTYTYDGLDRLLAIEDGWRKLTFTYDADHRRLSKSVHDWGIFTGWSVTSELLFLFDGDNEIGSYTSEGQPAELRLLGNGLGAEIGAAIAVELDGTRYVPIHDHRGNTALVLDTAGEPVELYHYDAFGNHRLHAPASSIAYPWRFASKRFDEETALTYFGRRYYCPIMARWLTPDPKGLQEGPNLYAFCINNPFIHFDLYGLESSTREDLARMRSYDSNFFMGMYEADVGLFRNRPTPRPPGRNYWGRGAVLRIAPQFDTLGQNWRSLGWGNRWELSKRGVVHGAGFVAGATTSAAAALACTNLLTLPLGASIFAGKTALHMSTRALRSGLPVVPRSSQTALRAGKAITSANGVRGWKVGQPIQNLTSKGNIPKWSTVRQRYWKNRAFYSQPGDFSENNLARMRRGLASQRENPYTALHESKELHHSPPQREGGLFDFMEVWPDEHAELDPFRIIGE